MGHLRGLGVTVGSILGSLWDHLGPFWASIWGIGLGSLCGHFWGLLSVLGSLWARLGSFGGHFGVFFGVTWDHFGVTLGSFRIIWGSLWDHFGGSFWGLFWGHLE